jgi:hypothetical protein
LAAAVSIGTAGATVASAAEGPPAKVVTAAERSHMNTFDVESIARNAKPLPVPEDRGKGKRQNDQAPQGPDGPKRTVEGAPPQSAAATASSATVSASSTTANGLWPGSFNANPNRQVGKLYFDIKIGVGEVWRHCSATAINSENKSLVLTAGHCVFNPDPDRNGYVTGNGSWYEHVQFCPGYEYSCKLGTWRSRLIYSANSWVYGSGGVYDWRDDIAVVLVSPNTSGYLVNAVGGQGITFNQATGIQRNAFGYPAPDYRFPSYATTYNGEDLVWCPGTDRADGYGHNVLGCTMTGGASGGPWLSWVASNWFGYANGVNSHKPTETTMGSPYFGTTESNLFQYARAR